MKAILYDNGIPFAKTHDLPELLNHIIQLAPLWEALRSQCESLTEYAAEFRYPGEIALKEDAKSALTSCKLIRREARVFLGLER
jgi:HEPN domain-containing protein